MNSHLRQTRNWMELAAQTHWSAAALANRLNLSLRTLERFFREEMGKNPQAWLQEHRQQRAVELLRAGFSVKQTAAILEYRYATHLSRDFKRHWGHAPTRGRAVLDPAAGPVSNILENGDRVSGVWKLNSVHTESRRVRRGERQTPACSHLVS